MKQEKIQKLISVAKLYYEQDKTQNEIARLYQVSRPMVSKLLREARELGIVQIRISDPKENSSMVLNRLKNRYGIQGGYFVPASPDDNRTNEALAAGAIRYLKKLGGKSLGTGWGTVIGEAASLLEHQKAEKGSWETVCPLVGNSGVSNRNYHTNETVRIFAQQSIAKPCYLYAPAFVETQQEMELIQRMDGYKAVKQNWEGLEVALVNIGNYPSTPDFASVARYGELLTKQKAAGRLLAYYFNEKGEIIRSDTDYTIQIPTPLLGRCREVVGVCSANVAPKALSGALRTGLIRHIIATEELAQAAVEY